MAIVALAENFSVTQTAAVSAEVVVSAPSVNTTITHATATNSSGSDVVVYLYRLASATAGAATTIMWRQNVPANSSAILTGLLGCVVETDQTIKVYAGTTAVININMSGKQ